MNEKERIRSAAIKLEPGEEKPKGYIKIEDILLPEEWDRAKKMYLEFKKKHKEGFAAECSKQIIEPVIERINKKLGQENIPIYFAHAIEYVCDVGYNRAMELMN